MTKTVPFPFVIEALERLLPTVRPMFGCHALYIGDIIMLMLRKKENNPEDNGVWIATSREHHESLRSHFPEMRSIKLLGNAGSGWQLIPLDADDFESCALRVCELILGKDRRIGKIPRGKKNKNVH